MPITCPQCKTTYQVPDDAIGTKGRQVKCITCKHVWHARVDPPVAAMASVAEASAPRARNTYKADDRQPAAHDAQPLKEAPRPAAEQAESVASAPSAPASPAPDADAEPVAIDEPVSSVTPVPAQEPVFDDEDIGIVDDGEDDVVNFAEGTATAEAGPVSANAMSDESAEIIANVSQAMIEIEGQSVKGSNPAASSPAASGPAIAPEIKVRKADNLLENLAGLGAIAAAVLLLFSAVVFREPIVRAVPETARMYGLLGMDVNLRGLEFANVATSSDFENGVPVLMVSGTIVNVSSDAVPLPSVRLALRTSGEQEVYAWSYKPSVKRLAAGEEVNFTTRVASPPDGAADIQMRFIGVDKPDGG